MTMPLDLLPVTISNQSKAQWERLCASTALSSQVLESEQALLSLWEQSPFCARMCMRHPNWLNDLVAMTDSSSVDFYAAYEKQLQEVLAEIREEESFKNKLREFRNKQMLLICWRDLILQAEVPQILIAVSALADVCTRMTLDWLQQASVEKFGQPLMKNKQRANLAMVALGKLGGRELNFSSDIDVMFFYTDSGQTDGAHSISNQEFFTAIAQKFIRIFSDITAEGFVFRVDCRLRPFGDSGPLVVTCNHIEDYYLTHGREWERYALIKARVVYGSVEDISHFNQIATAFVYRRYLDYGVVNTLRSMHSMIAQQVKSRGYENHVKLGVGGIREIEFIVQFFQLIRGGSNIDLQTNGLFDALQEIERAQFLEKFEVSDLTAAYLFLRRTENHIQMYDDQQTHELPTKDQAMQVLAQSMGYAEVSLFMSALHDHMLKVAALFASISNNGDQPKEENKYYQSWQLISNSNEGDSLQLPAPEKFNDWQQVCSKLQKLVHSSTYRSQDDVSRDRLTVFMPILLEQLEKADSPALVLERLNMLLTKMLRRSAYLIFLTENKSALEQLLAVVSVSPWIANHLTSYPVLLDELNVTIGDKAELDREQLHLGFNDQILQSPLQDYEYILERVRIFKHSHELHVACADIQGQLPIKRVSDQLSWLAEAVIHGCLDYLQYQTEQQPGQLAVIAFGKLGGIELSYGSDLDLVYIGKNGSNTVQISRLAQKLTQMLSLQTVSGRLYEIDSRLRPDGNAGPIVPSFDYVQKYYESRAWMWELQALVRARCIAGPEEICKQFEEMRRSLLSQARDKQLVAHEVSAMRSKMLSVKKSKTTQLFDLKNDEGGITDIEFMIQYAVLVHAHEEIALCDYSDNVRQLEGLAEHGYLSAAAASELDEIYCRYREQTHRLALQANSAHVAQEKYMKERIIVRNYWRELIEDNAS